MRYWDSSATVPLVVRQPPTDVARGWLADDPEQITWAGTAVELTSAIWRLAREGGLPETDALKAEERAETIIATGHVVADLEAVVAHARRLLRVHPLRAADALQLGAALLWAAGRPAGKVLHTFDDRLARAARREGFDVP